MKNNKFYCNNCETEVELINGICPKCNTNWKQIIEETTNNKEEFESYQASLNFTNTNSNLKVTESENIDINKTNSLLLFWGKAVKIGFIVIGIVVIILDILLSSIVSFPPIVGTVIGIILLFLGPIFESIIKWMAYLLDTNRKIANNIDKLVEISIKNKK